MPQHMNSLVTRTEKEELTVIEGLKWYHGGISRHVAEAILMANGVDGSFLLRDSKPIGQVFVISARGKDEVKHFKLEREGPMYSFGISEFDSIEHLMTHFANQPILCSNQGTMGQNFEHGTLVMLKYPYPAEVEEPEGFDEIRMHSTMSIDTEKKLDSRIKVCPLATKAGYLTKQGGSVKSWKMRWFVCIRNELKYFVERSDEKPINTLDLNDCNECYMTETPGKSFCFSLNFPDRIWIFSAQNEDDLNDWVKLLKWKLQHKG